MPRFESALRLQFSISDHYLSNCGTALGKCLVNAKCELGKWLAGAASQRKNEGTRSLVERKEIKFVSKTIKWSTPYAEREEKTT